MTDFSPSNLPFTGSPAETLLFGLFATILLIGSLGVILGKNPVHSVLFLILSFLNAAGLFVLLQAELVAMVLIIVYVGAVAVLFLFVVMMLDVNFRDLRQNIATYIPFALLAGGVILLELCAVGFLWRLPSTAGINTQQSISAASPIPNTHALGAVLYTDYILIFQLSGLILLVAMIGAIVLTLRKRPDVLRQNIQSQLERSPADTLTLHKIAPRQGVKL